MEEDIKIKTKWMAEVDKISSSFHKGVISVIKPFHRFNLFFPRFELKKLL